MRKLRNAPHCANPYWASHRHVKVMYEGANEIPIIDVLNDIKKWDPCSQKFFSGRYSSDIVMCPNTFEPIRSFKIAMIDPNCIDVCCLGTYDIHVAIEA